MIRDIVTYGHRILLFIAMRHNTTVSPNWRPFVYYYLLYVVFISRDSVIYDIPIFYFAAYRDASREGEGNGSEKRKTRLP